MFAHLYFSGDPRYSYQGDTVAKVLGIKWMMIRKDWRLVLELEYPDGTIDHASLLEAMDMGFIIHKPMEMTDDNARPGSQVGPEAQGRSSGDAGNGVQETVHGG